ncbi:MAG: DNA polymerase III subunit delta [Planctomycetes bacterium]|nr:DNA polymerase III subunit delta [Planctomycetota bacterium]
MIIFLYGEDTYRSRQKLKEFKDKFRREVDPAGSSLVTIDGENMNVAKIKEIIGSPSLFAKKRMIIIERLFSQKNKITLDEVHDYLFKTHGLGSRSIRAAGKEGAGTETAPTGNILIFWEEIDEPGKFGIPFWQNLCGLRHAQKFKKLSNTETIAWVKQEVSRRGADIRPAASVRLASLAGANLWQLTNEIEKLVGFKKGQADKLIVGDRPVIEAADVDCLVKGQLDENIFALTDAIGNKNKAEALRRFELELDAGVTEHHLLHMILRQFRTLLMVRQSLDKGLSPRQISSRLRLHPFVAQKSLNQVRNFSLPVLKNIFLRLVQTDQAVKTGQADAKTALTMLLAKI